MNCEKCHELLSDLLDGTLTGEARILLSRHLDECTPCAAARADLSAIITTARTVRDYATAPPSRRALWLRISNTIEAEREEQRLAAARVTAAAAAAHRESFVTRALHKRWTLTLPQLSAAVAALVVAVSAVTVFSVQGLRHKPTDVVKPQVAAHRSINDQELELLMQRVAQRKTRWNPRMREAFERNLSVIDAAVNDSLQQLDETPHDVVSEEALDAAMRGKKELLREFAEL
jgi:anti-sigma factor RsiW